jgi:hypothetical protein
LGGIALTIKVTVQSTPKGYQAHIWKSNGGSVRQTHLQTNYETYSKALDAAVKELTKNDPQVNWDKP